MSSTAGKLAFRWIAANTLAWTLAAGTTLRSNGRWDAIAGGASGAIIGTAQWAALRRHFGLSPRMDCRHLAGLECVGFGRPLMSLLGHTTDVPIAWNDPFTFSLYWPVAAGAMLGGVV